MCEGDMGRSVRRGGGRMWDRVWGSVRGGVCVCVCMCVCVWRGGYKVSV